MPVDLEWARRRCFLLGGESGFGRPEGHGEITEHSRRTQPMHKVEICIHLCICLHINTHSLLQ
jgi:hypothetical protein